MVPLPSFKMENYKTPHNGQGVEQLDVHFTQVLSQTDKVVKFSTQLVK